MMFVILPKFKTLYKYAQYCANCKQALESVSHATFDKESKPSDDKPDCCPHCHHPVIHHHGHYERKPDRGHLDYNTSLNPVIIKRYRCVNCQHTFSALPECLPPRRWYPWDMQEHVLKAAVAGDSKNAISKCLTLSRRTIGRWLSRFTEQWQKLQHHFKARWPDLGYVAGTFAGFWQALLQHSSLASAMHYLHTCGAYIP